jgi:hypothetical protein
LIRTTIAAFSFSAGQYSFADRASPAIRQLRRLLKPSSAIRKPPASRFAMGLPIILQQVLYCLHVEDLLDDDALELGIPEEHEAGMNALDLLRKHGVIASAF